MKVKQANRNSLSAVAALVRAPTKRRRTGGTLVAGVVGGLAILSLLLVAGSTPSAQAAADISFVAVDMDTTGNNTVSCAGNGCMPGTLGTVQSCAAVPVNGTVNIDIVVETIPVTNPNPSGAGPNIQGFDMDLIYSPAFVQVSGHPGNAPGGPPGNLSMIYAGTPSGPHSSITDLPPDSDGEFRMGELDFGVTGESGPGILMRLTLKGLTAGTSVLHLQDSLNASPVPSLYDNSGSQNAYTIDYNHDGLIVVGGSCPQTVPNAITGEFCIYGPSTGAGWNWAVTGTGPYSGSGTVASGGTAPDIAAAWVKSMNGPFPAFAGVSLTAIQFTGSLDHCFGIFPWNSTLTLIVDGCPVTLSGCSFNPTVFAVSPVGGIAELRVGDSNSLAVGTDGSGGPIPYATLVGGLAVAAALITGLWYGRRWWLR